MVTGSLKQHKTKKKQLKIQENRTFNGKNIRFCDFFQDSASRTGRQPSHREVTKRKRRLFLLLHPRLDRLPIDLFEGHAEGTVAFVSASAQ